MLSQFLRESSYIAGAWVKAGSSATLNVTNPATHKVIGTIPNCGATETEDAIIAAAKAFPAWRATSSWDRSKLIMKLVSLIEENQEELAKLLTSEQGKPLAEARTEILYGASYFRWFAEEAKRIDGEIISSSSSAKRLSVQREPIGVVGFITPWNFPQAMLARKIAPALAAGCTIVAKPDDKTPYSALALGVLAEQAGFPAGVINIVTGEPALIAKALMDSDTVRKVSFTGSTRVGKLLLEQSAKTLKKLTLELGGNAPFIVFDDADLDRAVEHCVQSKFRNGGQTCVCVNRVLVHRPVLDRFSKLLIEQVNKIEVGDGMSPGTTVGPMISMAQVNKVCDLVSDALKNGGKLVVGGVPDQNSQFVEPIVLSDVTPAMKIFREEIFGPVVCLYPFETEADAIALANNTEYGLAAYFYTRDLNRSIRVQESLQFGMVGVNETQIFSAEVPFGGIKHSGFGREGGHYGIEEYVNLKYVCVGV